MSQIHKGISYRKIHGKLTSMMNVIIPRAKRTWEIFNSNRIGQVGLVLFTGLVIVAILSPIITPYEPMAQHYHPDGSLLRFEGPSWQHPLGTTIYGRDVFSQLIAGTRIALFVGLATATLSVSIGTTAGIVAAYVGGTVDEVIMRIVDMLYSLPTLPFALLVLVFMGRSIYAIVFLLGFVYWRTPARIIRSEALSIKENEFVESAKVDGAGPLRIMGVQILPNVLPLAFLYFAILTGRAIIVAAGIAFLGFGDPERISWGRMIHEAWLNSGIQQQIYWVLAPGFMIVLIVLSIFFLSHTYEQVANPRLQE